MPDKVLRPSTDMMKMEARISALERKFLEAVRLLKPLDFAGDAGGTTKFTLPRGQRPYAAWVGDTPQIEGSANEWVEIEDAGLFSIEFAVAPGDGVAIIVLPKEV